MSHELKLGPLVLPTPLLMAPMAGYSDLPFRLAVRALGGLGLAFTEMLNPHSVLIGGGRKRTALLATSPEDRLLGHQTYGSDTVLVVEAARWLEAHGAALIDINLGCPTRKIANRGAGAGFLKKPDQALRMVREVVQAVRLPVTVKLRLGWDTNLVSTTGLIGELEQSGVKAITLHARTGIQGFTGAADWREIRRAVETVKSVPVIGNGDVFTPLQALAMFRETGCHGIMIGRGILKDPWLIRRIWDALQGKPDVEPAREERARFFLDHLDAMARHYGEKMGPLLFRKWIPQYAPALRLDKATKHRWLQIRDGRELRDDIVNILLT